ncbi:MAG: DUF262 domain-containing protein [Deltaproteobacteria bacterium]|jgi:hypothetical protein|nr:DUF262 domain-containing protein [Deltaproteobacteria bacterium]
MPKSNDISLEKILSGIKDATIRLPDFQRGWVWDDERIRALITSITCSYPVGAVMFLEYSGDGIRFKSRTFTNVPDNKMDPKTLVLDGQQRLTSVYCSMYSKDPVPTISIQREKIARFYYLKMEKCLEPDFDRMEAVISVPEDKLIKSDFGRHVDMDLRTSQGEFKNHMFPLNIVFDPIAVDEWKYDYQNFHNSPEKTQQLHQFTRDVLNPIIKYTLPVIELEKETPKEAVCQVFENVNTGGVALTVFELITAIFAANDFNLRDDWNKRKKKMLKAKGTFNLLSVIEATDFLASMTLLAQKKRNRTMGVKRKDVLSLSLNDYKEYADDLTDGYIKAALFLVQECILAPRDLPYVSQFVPLTVIMAILGNRANDGVIRSKLASWYWCGVFGEMYGSSNETRYVNDVTGVLSWIDDGDPPDTLNRAFFQPTRLLSLQTRNGAAYKGVMALILGEDARDFISGNKMDFTNFVGDQVDIHHIFPQQYCKQKLYDKHKWNSIVNKTPITLHTNRTIGAASPSKYLKKIEKKVSRSELDRNVASHSIDVKMLRDDDFDAFFISRSKTLLGLISKAMGKTIDNLNSPDIVEKFGAPLD